MKTLEKSVSDSVPFVPISDTTDNTENLFSVSPVSGIESHFMHSLELLDSQFSESNKDQETAKEGVFTVCKAWYNVYGLGINTVATLSANYADHYGIGTRKIARNSHYRNLAGILIPAKEGVTVQESKNGKKFNSAKKYIGEYFNAVKAQSPDTLPTFLELSSKEAMKAINDARNSAIQATKANNAKEHEKFQVELQSQYVNVALLSPELQQAIRKCADCTSPALQVKIAKAIMTCIAKAI